jgi:hypothetical protein
MANPDRSITIPTIDTWPKDAIHPILERIIKWHGGFHVTIKTLTGHKFRVQVFRDEIVKDLQRRCAEQLMLLHPDELESLYPSNFKDKDKMAEVLRLMFKGKQLADDAPISSTFEENSGDMVHLVYKLRGGARTPSRTPLILRINLKFLRRAVKFIPGEIVAELKRRVSEHYWFRRRYGCAQEDGITFYFKGLPLSDDTAVNNTGARYIGDLVMRLEDRNINHKKKMVQNEDLPLGMIVDFHAVLERYSK